MTEEELKKKCEERARKLEESQTLGVYDNDEDLARDEEFNKGEVYGYEEGFKDGAEFGYNNANEWHYVKDGDLPKDEDWKWCVSYRGYYYVAKYEEMFGCWTNQEYSEVMQPYAWKEIVLPELKERE